MNEEDSVRVSLIVGMLHALAGHFQSRFSGEQQEMFKYITAQINAIFYPKSDKNNNIPWKDKINLQLDYDAHQRKLSKESTKEKNNG